MRKLVLFVLLLLLVDAGAQAQGIIRSLERTVPGQGKVTIHQDPRIEALIGMERPATGEQKVIKASGFRIQAYAGNNTRQRVFSGVVGIYFVYFAPLALSCG